MITSVAAGSSKDVDIAVEAAKKVGLSCYSFHLLAAFVLNTHISGVQNDLGFEMPWKYTGETVKQACGTDGGS